MPLPSFSRTGVTTLTFSRGDAFPRAQEGDERQIVGESEAGTVRIATLSDPVEWIVLDFAQRTLLPNADYVNLGVFLKNSLINFKANTFTFTDTDGTAYTVRYWTGYYGFTKTSSVLWQGTLTLRKELA